MKIKSRAELKKIKGGRAIYNWLLRNNRALLDKHLPIADTVSPNKTKIEEEYFKLGKKPSQYSKDLEEKRLGKTLSRYSSSKSSSYQEEWWNEMLRKYPFLSYDSVLENKTKIEEEYFKLGKRPSSTSKDLEEKRLGRALSKYSRPKSKSYQEEWWNEMQKKYTFLKK